MTSAKEVVSAIFTTNGKNVLYQDLSGRTVLADTETGQDVQEYVTSPQPQNNIRSEKDLMR